LYVPPGIPSLVGEALEISCLSQRGTNWGKTHCSWSPILVKQDKTRPPVLLLMVIFVWNLLQGQSSRTPQEQLLFSNMVLAWQRKPYSLPKILVTDSVRMVGWWSKLREQNQAGMAGAMPSPTAIKQT